MGVVVAIGLANLVFLAFAMRDIALKGGSRRLTFYGIGLVLAGISSAFLMGFYLKQAPEFMEYMKNSFLILGSSVGANFFVAGVLLNFDEQKKLRENTIILPLIEQASQQACQESNQLRFPEETEKTTKGINYTIPLVFLLLAFVTSCNRKK
ncbi:hypothetical protein [Acidovorax sp. SUPP2825]|uniref:hypothetical protein n=1 Tax=Acidovorax sp. SUPP2825 TaxID=2920879 RepID=UPI0023DE48EE|nr:hypothetical protein [Acidovorax sp. SUPP2825]GKS97662.1 hypothetical protein AVAK2825_24025 [Acidovorax sp. SUPP2825]